MLCFYPESGWLSSPAWLRSMRRFRGTPFGHELPAAATMLVAQHMRAAPNRARWRVAVVVLRYFVAVLLAPPTRAQKRVASAGRPIESRLTSNPLIRTTHLWTVVVSCGNHCATTRSRDPHRWTSMVGCRCLWLKDVAKSVCDGDHALARHGERGSLTTGSRPAPYGDSSVAHVIARHHSAGPRTCGARSTIRIVWGRGPPARPQALRPTNSPA